MKLSSLYSVDERIFPRIDFNSGFNVIFAKVEDPEKKFNDSHNLGKTFLIKVIDYCLLCGLDKDHPFRIHKSQFANFIFFLELITVNGKYVTIRRSIDSSKIFINISSQREKDLSNFPDISWSYQNLSLEKARKVLNKLLDLEVITPYDYRKGLGYFLRSQTSYDEIFKISKFRQGKEKYWKPFISILLGFNGEIIKEKYDLDDSIKELRKKLDIFETEARSKSEEYDEIRGLIEVNQDNIFILKNELDEFSFKNVESEINETTVNIIENKISSLNERRYVIDYELNEIEKSLQYKGDINLNEVKQLFNEVAIELPQLLVKKYEQLIDFNRKITKERFERLAELREKFIQERQQVVNELEKLDSNRQNALEILKEKDTFIKFKEMQEILIDKEKELLELKQRLIQLDKAGEINNQISASEKKLNEMISEINSIIRQDNIVLKEIRKTYKDIVKYVLGIEILLSVRTNRNGNLEFLVKTLDKNQVDRITNEDKGTSYRKLLAACFDLSLLIVYSNKKFYRFVYHDGIFEGLDNRKKVNLLKVIRDACHDYGIQYILTVIDSDLPRNQLDKKLLFTEEEIVRKLHDDGNDGRLFRMDPF